MRGHQLTGPHRARFACRIVAHGESTPPSMPPKREQSKATTIVLPTYAAAVALGAVLGTTLGEALGLQRRAKDATTLGDILVQDLAQQRKAQEAKP